MQTFIAGRDAAKFDQSDWDIPIVPVLFNPKGLANVDAMEKLIRECVESWALRYSKHRLEYAGRTSAPYTPGAITINWESTSWLETEFGSTGVAGLCRYRTKFFDASPGKWILEGCEIYINMDSRSGIDNFTRGTVTHEIGHACGIHGHGSHMGGVMYKSSMGNWKLTRGDCEMLDAWNAYDVQLHPNFDLSVPVVEFGDGARRWVDLKYTGNGFLHSWQIAREEIWSAPAFQNVRLGETVEWQGVPCQRVFIQRIVGAGYADLSAQFLYAPNGTLILEFAR